MSEWFLLRLLYYLLTEENSSKVDDVRTTELMASREAANIPTLSLTTSNTALHVLPKVEEPILHIGHVDNNIGDNDALVVGVLFKNLLGKYIRNSAPGHLLISAKATASVRAIHMKGVPWCPLGKALLAAGRLMFDWPYGVRLPNARKRSEEKKDSYLSLSKTEKKMFCFAVEHGLIKIRPWNLRLSF